MEFYHRDDNNKIRQCVKWLVDIIAVIALAWFLVYAYGTQIPVAGRSMSPFLEPGDVVLMDRLAYDFGRPDRYDVVVFRREDGRLNIKRVVGLPGETVQITGGQVLINDIPLSAYEKIGKVSLPGIAENPIRLGEGEYFLLGDNSGSSEDSRFVNVGNVSLGQIVGKVWSRLLPVSRLELID